MSTSSSRRATNRSPQVSQSSSRKPLRKTPSSGSSAGQTTSRRANRASGDSSTGSKVTPKRPETGQNRNNGSASVSQKKMLSGFDTPSGNISSSGEASSRVSQINSKLITPKRETFIMSSTQKGGPTRVKLASSSESEDENTRTRTSTRASSATSGAIEREMKEKADALMKSSEVKEEESGEEESGKVSQTSGTIEENQNESSSISRSSSRSSSIGVLLLGRTRDEAEGIISLHSRSSSPVKSPMPQMTQTASPLSSPFAGRILEQPTDPNSLVLNLPDRARIDSPIKQRKSDDELSGPIPRFASDIDDSSSVKESDGEDSSAIKPPEREESYSDSMSPLSSSTDPTYSYLDPVPENQNLNVSKITTDREIYAPESALESTIMYAYPDHEDFEDTDEEPSISNPELIKKELMAEIRKPSNNKIPTSQACLLL